jgi:dihydroorotate dehydrogenase electron transfer subunit
VSAPPFGRRPVPVTANRAVGAYRVLGVEDAQGPPPAAGQFYMLACREGWGAGTDERPFLPRAFSVMRCEGPTLQFLLEDVGPGTARLCAASEGEELWITGPLGRGFSPPRGAAILAGGGIGIAPLVIWQDELARTGVPTRVVLGFRGAEHAQGAALLADASIATDDGSVGHHGPVTELLEAALAEDPTATVYACGPPGMLEAVRALCEGRGAACELALEAGMACGFGACFGCVVPTRQGYVRVCLDGPVLDAALLAAVT